MAHDLAMQSIAVARHGGSSVRLLVLGTHIQEAEKHGAGILVLVLLFSSGPQNGAAHIWLISFLPVKFPENIPIDTLRGVFPR